MHYSRSKNSRSDAEASIAVRRLCSRKGVPDPRSAVKACARELLDQCWPNQPVELPVDIEVLARQAGIVFVRPQFRIRGVGGRTSVRWNRPHGTLTPDGRLFRMRHCDVESEQGWRVVLGHEIGHTFFYERIGGRPTRPGGLPASDDEEHWCEFAARELLIPEEQFSLLLGNLSFGEGTASSVLELARRFSVSTALMSTRLLEDYHKTAKQRGVVQVACWHLLQSAKRPSPETLFRRKSQWAYVRRDLKDRGDPQRRFRRRLAALKRGEPGAVFSSASYGPGNEWVLVALSSDP